MVSRVTSAQMPFKRSAPPWVRFRVSLFPSSSQVQSFRNPLDAGQRRFSSFRSSGMRDRSTVFASSCASSFSDSSFGNSNTAFTSFSWSVACKTSSKAWTVMSGSGSSDRRRRSMDRSVRLTDRSVTMLSNSASGKRPSSGSMNTSATRFSCGKMGYPL